MPTNVGAEYIAAEEKYLKATDKKEKIRWLKEMIKAAPKHKGTEKLLAQLKKTLKKLEEELDKEKIQKSKGKKDLFSVEKEGEALVSLVGLPNSGKSSILAKLTSAKPIIADYPFSTTKPEVGMINYGGSLIQLVDLPPLIEGSVEERGYLFGVINNSDLLLLVFDLSEDVNEQWEVIMNEFNKAKILLGKDRPNITIKKSERGGLEIIGLENKYLKEARKLLMKKRIINGIVNVKASFLDFKHYIEDYKFLKALIVANKGDSSNSLENYKKLEELVKEYNEKNNLNLDIVPISIRSNINIDKLKGKIWDKLNLIRVFTKDPRKKEADYPPITLKRGSTIEDLVKKIHEEFLEKFKYAKVYGKSAKFPGQNVGLTHILEDKDIVEIYLN